MGTREQEQGVILIAILFIITIALMAYVVINSLSASSEDDQQGRTGEPIARGASTNRHNNAYGRYV